MKTKSMVSAVLLTLCLFAALSAVPMVFSQQSDGSSDILATGSVAFENEVIRLVNQERVDRGLLPLKPNSSLTAAARAHNEDMIIHDYFGHEGWDGSSPAERACAYGYAPYGWGECYVGENIAAGYLTPADVVDAWMASPGHLANILNTYYREIGVGHNTGGTYGNYWTMDLGAQPNVLPVFINQDDPETDSVNVMVWLSQESVSSWGSIGDIVSVRLSENSSFAGAQWRSFAAIVPFTLSSSNGLKTVYVQFSDGSNQVVSSDSITLLAPTLVVAPQSIVFMLTVDGADMAPAFGQLLIDCEGRPSLEWTASQDQSWLVLEDTGGMTPSSLGVTVDENAAPFHSIGNWSGYVIVEAVDDDTVDSPQAVPVTVHVVDTIYRTYLPSVQR